MHLSLFLTLSASFTISYLVIVYVFLPVVVSLVACTGAADCLNRTDIL